MDKSILTVLADNPALLEELRKVLVAEFAHAPIEVGFSNERLGEIVKARLVGEAAIERAFSKILTYKTPAPKEEARNPAR